MADKINVKSELVILHGDEMAQVAFEEILERFVKKRLNINLIEKDLSAKNRLKTNGAIIEESIKDLNKYGVGVKNAGVTVNRKQLDDFLKEMPELSRDSLKPLATKSPNGAIRKGIGGNIKREDIPFTNLKPVHPDWQNITLDVVTMDDGGQKDSYNEVSKVTGYLQVKFIPESTKKAEILHERFINKGDPWLIASNNIDNVKKWAKELFKRAIDERRDVYIGLKDTVIPGYDGVMKEGDRKNI